MIKIIKPLIYGLYMWLRHFISHSDFEHGYFWRFLNNDYLTLWHPVIMVTKWNRSKITKIQSEINELIKDQA